MASSSHDNCPSSPTGPVNNTFGSYERHDSESSSDDPEHTNFTLKELIHAIKNKLRHSPDPDPGYYHLPSFMASHNAFNDSITRLTDDNPKLADPLTDALPIIWLLLWDIGSALHIPKMRSWTLFMDPARL